MSESLSGMWFLFVLNVFSLCFLFFCLFEAACFLNYWFMLELLSLSVVPYFVFWSFGYNRRCLLQYIVVLLISSFFLVFGLMLSSCRDIFLCFGVLLKLGVFPFMAWLYEVVVFSNWVVVWVVSGFLKVPIFLIFYIRGFDVMWLGCILCFFSFLLLSVNFCKISFGWRYCWCHMMLSGSAGLVVVSLFCPIDSISYLFVVYVVWCSLVLWLFSFLDVCGFNCWTSLLYLFFLISFPFSFAIVYKLALSVSMLFSSFFVFCAWCAYTIVEQLYMMFFFIGRVRVRSVVTLSSFV